MPTAESKTEKMLAEVRQRVLRVIRGSGNYFEVRNDLKMLEAWLDEGPIEHGEYLVRAQCELEALIEEMEDAIR
jgi:hypothetical protein